MLMPGPESVTLILTISTVGNTWSSSFVPLTLSRVTFRFGLADPVLPRRLGDMAPVLLDVSGRALQLTISAETETVPLVGENLSPLETRLRMTCDSLYLSMFTNTPSRGFSGQIRSI